MNLRRATAAGVLLTPALLCAAPASPTAPPALRGCAIAAGQAPLMSDDFDRGTAALHARWLVQQQDPRGRVAVEGGVLAVEQPAGLSVWLRQPLEGDYAVTFTALALPAPASAGALAGRLSDLNLFWNATDPRATGGDPTQRPRSGAFAAYDDLRAYYVGFGANGNTTTRLRRYDGTGVRALLNGHADAAQAEAGDRAGPMTTATRLQPGVPVQVALVSRRPTAQDPVNLRWWANGVLVFEHADPEPLLQGWFALRTTVSRFQFSGFRVWRCGG